MRLPGIINADDLAGYRGTRCLVNGRWCLARPAPYYGPFRRIKAAWLVFTGKADALKWYGQ